MPRAARPTSDDLPPPAQRPFDVDVALRRVARAVARAVAPFEPAAIAALSLRALDALIDASTFHEAKARQIHALAVRTDAEFGGTLPPDAAVLTRFAGVGPKCAHLALGVAAGGPLISVDVHVHRVTNRWGYVAAPTPARTLAALARVLPERHHIAINRLLVPFGKHACTGVRPKCSTCPVRDLCARGGRHHPPVKRRTERRRTKKRRTVRRRTKKRRTVRRRTMKRRPVQRSAPASS